MITEHFSIKNKPLVWVPYTEDVETGQMVLVRLWRALENPTNVGTAMAERLEGAIKRASYGRSSSRDVRRLYGKLRSEYSAVLMADELTRIIKSTENGDTGVVTSETTEQVLFLVRNPEGAFIGLTKIGLDMPVYIDGVPDYIYDAKISAIGLRGLVYNPHLITLLKETMSYGITIDDVKTCEITHIPEMVTVMPKYYAQGKISMEEVNQGIASPHTRPILIK